MAEPVVIRMELLGVERGVWCDECALPSAVIVTFTIGDSVTSRRRCLNHEADA